MSLTLARLCGEWRLVSEIYEARSGKYEAQISIFRIPTAENFTAGYRDFGCNSLLRNIAISSGKNEAPIAIFCIFAAVDRFSWISWKVESRWGKSESRQGKLKIWKPLLKIWNVSKKAESHWRNRKAVQEDFLRFLGNRKAVEEIQILSKENRILG